MTKQIMVRQANVLTMARYSFDVVEARIIFLILRRIRKDYIDSEEGQKNLFGDFVVKLYSDELKEAENISRVYKAAMKLRHKDITIDNKDLFLNVGYIDWVRHHKKENYLEVQISRQILPYFIDLVSNFTVYNSTFAMTLQSSYSQRFYQICAQYRTFNNGVFFMEIEELRKILMLEKKYPLLANFRERVLDVAQKELEEKYKRSDFENDLYFTYAFDEKTKQGKRYTRINFKVHSRKTIVQIADANTYINLIHLHIAPLFSRDKKYIARIVETMRSDNQKAHDIADKCNKKFEKYKTGSTDKLEISKNNKELAKIIRTALKLDFKIE